MPRSPHIRLVDGTYHLELSSLIQRINRYLRILHPRREIYYEPRPEQNYFVRVIELDDPEHGKVIGPYYFKYMVALGDMLNIWSIGERNLPKIIHDRRGNVYAQEPLPDELKFETVTPVLRDALRALYHGDAPTTRQVVQALQARGYTVTPPAALSVEAPLTAPVTDGEALGAVMDVVRAY